MSNPTKAAAFLLLALSLPFSASWSAAPAQGQAPAPGAATPPGAAGAVPAPAAPTGGTDLPDFTSLGFGIGLAVTFLDEPEILETVVANNIVRISDSEKTKRDAWLESHYTFENLSAKANWNYLAPGIFVAIQVAGEGATFDGFGTGLMLSWKRTKISDTKDKRAFNVAAGWVNRKIRILGDGVTANEPLPEGEESVRYRRKDSTGWMLMFSFTVY